MSSITFLLGTSLLKKDKKIKVDLREKKAKFPRRSRRDASVECFLRKALGNGLIQVEDKLPYNNGVPF